MGYFVVGWKLPGGKKVLVNTEGRSRASALASAEEELGGEPLADLDQELLHQAKRPVASARRVRVVRTLSSSELKRRTRRSRACRNRRTGRFTRCR